MITAEVGHSSEVSSSPVANSEVLCTQLRKGEGYVGFQFFLPYDAVAHDENIDDFVSDEFIRPLQETRFVKYRRTPLC